MFIDSIKLTLASYPLSILTGVGLFTLLCFLLFLKKKRLFILLVCLFSLGLFILISCILHFRWDTLHALSIKFKVSETELPNKILIIGDSHVYQSNFPKGFSTKLRINFPSLEITTIGYNGATTRQVFENLLQEPANLNNADYQTVIIFTGTNDIINNVSTKETVHYLNQFKDKFRYTKTYVISPHTINLPNLNTAQNNFNKELQSNFSSNLIPWFETSKQYKQVTLWDGIHLNAKGNTQLAFLIIQILKTNKSDTSFCVFPSSLRTNTSIL